MAKEKYASPYKNTFNSFSGADIVAVVTSYDGKSVVLGSLQTVSYSVYRSTSPVYALGRVGAKGAVRGARTIAGSLIFAVFDRHALYEVMVGLEGEDMYTPLKSDEIPPFDITISFMNELGESAQLVIYGVHLISEGQTMSVEDLMTESVMEYIAMDIDEMMPDSISL